MKKTVKYDINFNDLPAIWGFGERRLERKNLT